MQVSSINQCPKKKKYGKQTEFLCSRLLEKIKNEISVFFHKENEKDGEEFYDSNEESDDSDEENDDSEDEGEEEESVDSDDEF